MSDKKVIVITGGSAGIGAALAHIVAREGHTLVLAARRKEQLDAVAAACGGGALGVVCDVTRRADVEAVRDAALAAHGRVDVWVNNAGRGIGRSVLDLTDEDVDAILSVNLKSALYGMQAIVPTFKAQRRGHVINVSSFLGRVPLVSFRSIYSASKAALNVLTSNLRMDLRAELPDVRVSLVLPGPVATEFAANALFARPNPIGAKGIPGLQSADEVARVIADVIASPVDERYTSDDLAATARRYYEDVGAFEAQMPPPGAPPAKP